MYVSRYMYESSLCRLLRVRAYARRKSVLNVNGPGAVPFLTFLSARIVVSLSRKEFANGVVVVVFVLVVLVFFSANSG
jgi:hypothetical protein